MEGAAQTVAKRCTTCGATADFPPAVVSVVCNYCASPLVDTDRAAAHIDRVAPFRIQRSVAEQKLKEHLAGRFWAPDAIRKGIVADHKLQAVLIPFWAYSGVARSQYGAQVGIYWYRTETYVDSNGKTKTRTKRETEWFSMSGSAILTLSDHLVSASCGLPEPESNALEPFDMGRAVAFDPLLVSGWTAELPSIARENADSTAAGEVREAEAARIQHQLLPGDVNQVKSVSTEISIDKVDLVLLPVWVASYRHGKKIYRQLVNGQSGKCVGGAPTSWLKVTLAVIGGLGLLAGLYFLGVSL